MVAFALSHCAISSATCNRTLKNLFVAVAEVRCYTVQRDLSNLQRFVPTKPGKTRYWHAGVGGRSDLQRNQRPLGKNCVSSCCRGVTLCNGGCKLLRLIRKVELDSTSCNVARNKKKDALQVAAVPCYTAHSVTAPLIHFWFWKVQSTRSLRRWAWRTTSPRRRLSAPSTSTSTSCRSRIIRSRPRRAPSGLRTKAHPAWPCWRSGYQAGSPRSWTRLKRYSLTRNKYNPQRLKGVRSSPLGAIYQKPLFS